MKLEITNRNVGILCRICLTSSKNLISLTDPVVEKVLNLGEDITILLMLEMVTCNKVALSDQLPSKICPMCLSFLKMTHEFQMQFKRSQELLNNAINGEELKERKPEVFSNSDLIKHEKPVEVELIYGQNSYDLNDVIIVETEYKENESYQGFLSNLGTEISARFVGENNPPPEHQMQNEDHYDISLETRRNTNVTGQLDFNNLDLSRLKVSKNPEECEIVVEEVIGSTTTTIKTLYECQICGKLFPERNDLETHREVKHNFSQIFVCEKCGHQAHTRSQLYHHLRMHDEKTFQCNHCDKKYNTSSRLKAHLACHKNERSHLCNHCGKSFNYATSLKYHLEMHAGRNLVCNVCGLKFTRPNTLKRHLRTHTRDRPFPCQYCLKRFPSKNEKAAHEMIHTGIKPYACKFCNKTFTKSFNMQIHCLSHPGPLQCHLCTKTFVDMKYLKMHTKRAHKELIEELEN